MKITNLESTIAAKDIHIKQLVVLFGLWFGIICNCMYPHLNPAALVALTESLI